MCLQEFTKRFHEEAPFEYAVGVEQAYKLLVQFHQNLLDLEKEGEHVNQQQELFEVAVVNWRDLKACRGELVQLKLAWDHVQVRTHFLVPPVKCVLR